MRTRAKPGLEIVVDPDRAEASLWRRLRFEGEERCRETLFSRYAPLARAIAARFQKSRPSTNGDRGDLEQFAFEGLLQSLDRFNPLQGVPFGAYARPRINGNISDGMARMSDLATQVSHLRRVNRERVSSLADSPVKSDPLDLLADLALDLAIGLMLEETGIVEPEDGSDARTNVYEGLVWKQAQAALSSELARLPEKEGVVVRHHYQTGLNFAAIADLMRLTRGRVSQLHKAAIERLRYRLRHFQEK